MHGFIALALGSINKMYIHQPKKATGQRATALALPSERGGISNARKMAQGLAISGVA